MQWYLARYWRVFAKKPIRRRHSFSLVMIGCRPRANGQAGGGGGGYSSIGPAEDILPHPCKIKLLWWKYTRKDIIKVFSCILLLNFGRDTCGPNILMENTNKTLVDVIRPFAFEMVRSCRWYMASNCELHISFLSESFDKSVHCVYSYDRTIDWHTLLTWISDFKWCITCMCTKKGCCKKRGRFDGEECKNAKDLNKKTAYVTGSDWLYPLRAPISKTVDVSFCNTPNTVSMTSKIGYGHITFNHLLVSL